MSRRPYKLSLALIAALLLAFAILAILQYRWIGEVSEAARQRLQNSVQLATSGFADEFNGEVARALMALIRSQSPFDSGFRSDYGELYLQWKATTVYPQIIRNVFVVEVEKPEEPRLFQLDGDLRRLEPTGWPDHLLDVKEELAKEPDARSLEPLAGERPLNSWLPGASPTVVVPLAPFGRNAGWPPPFTPPGGSPRFRLEPVNWVIVEFDQNAIVTEVFPELVRRYFSALGQGEYHVAVVSRSQPDQIIYQSDASVTAKDFASADSEADLFMFRPGGLPLPDRRGLGVRFGREPFNLPAPPPAAGHWQLLVEHRLGSLDAAVNNLRQRNLAVGFGVLLVLVGGVIMIIVASERARMLARLQMKFAAGVSHELRTPLAAIQALAYNLASGVIKEPAEIAQYARMVQDEARGLTGMVDQVLLFAENRSMRRKFDLGPVEVVEAVDHALATLTAEIRKTRVEIITEIPDDAPTVRANFVALTHCIRNLVSNALKYGTDSDEARTIRIVALSVPEKSQVQISVIDQGPGIDPEDFPHIFEPFYRGRSAAPGIRGAGLGLYLVKQLVEAKDGAVTFESQPGAGSKFTLHLPVFG